MTAVDQSDPAPLPEIPAWHVLGFASAEEAAYALDELTRQREALRRRDSAAIPDDERRAIAIRVCERVADGGVGNTFKRACEAEGITRGTLFKWVLADKDLRALYNDARTWQAHGTAEDAIDLADSATPEDVHVRRLQVDTRKWYTSKIAPKIYGDQLALTGPAGIPLAPAPTTRFDPSKLSTVELEQLEQIYAKGLVVDVPLDGQPVAEIPAPAAPPALPAPGGD